MNEISKRSKILRKTTPDCLIQQFEAQNRICDLCDGVIQDVVLAELDHSIPIIFYARSLNTPIEQAIKDCNSLHNLRATHSSCNAVKHDLTRDEWFAQGKNNREVKIFSEKEILELRYRAGEGGRNRFRIHGDAFTAESRSRGGKTSGIQNVLNGHLESIRTKENQAKGGRTNVLNGNLERIRSLDASIRGGKTQGRIAVESGQLASITTFEVRSKGGKKQGPIQGRKNVESGQLAALRTPEHQKEASHIRWHTNRNIVNPKCKLCMEQSNNVT